jgi:uncharacterized protein
MTQTIMATTAQKIAKELNVKLSQVEAATRLLDEGATVPFISRYRKEATEGLDDTQLRQLTERLHYLRELDDRREIVLRSIREQEKLVPELEQAILLADTKTRLEDLYLPYRPKRRTKAMIAKEAGLEPLAMALWQNPSLDPQTEAAAFLNPEALIDTADKALEGAQQILMEQFAEHADLLEEMRHYLWNNSVLSSTGGQSKKDTHHKYTDYLKYAEPIRKIPSHRALALFRGRRENALQLSLSLPDAPDYGEKRLLAYFNIADSQRPADPWLLETVRLTWKGKIATKLELELLTRLRELADEEAIRVFASNLHDLLLASPAGSKITIGLDPGIRTGIKVAVVDNTGKLLDYTTVFPLAPHNQLQQSIADIAKLAAKYRVELISIGNGTGSRETERLCADLIKMYPDLKLTKVLVSEAGASVYSASELAANEFPDLDVTLRGAVSIARRLQDPLAELVKIDPKSIGVGQYQHDVNQARLARCLEGVVEDCVNAVGVDVNRASAPLLMRVSGLNEILAKNLIQYRDEHGPFKNRQQLKLVPRMGEKTFMLAAGFLRITDGDNPLDASGVHPEAYPLVEKMLADKQLELQQTIGQHSILQSVNAEHYVDEHFGLPTIRDVLLELEKPGRDPRPEFKTATFKEGIEDINHLHEGMILEGVVSNVTNFGAFVDIGVHQDGLIHISAMTNRFINDPRSVVKAGDIVTVRVVEVDKNRRRIGLSMKLEEEKIEPTKVSKPSHEPKTITPKVHASKKHSKPEHKKQVTERKPPENKKAGIFNTAMADALAKLKERI